MIYELVMQGIVAGQETINRWNYVNYEATDDHLGSFGLVTAVGAPATGTPPVFTPDSMLATIMLALSQNYEVTGIAAKAIYDPLDFYEIGITPPAAGAVEAIVMSPILAFGFRTQRKRTDIRRAYKRFAGVPQGSLTNDGVLDSPTVSQMANIATQMEAIQTATPGASAYNYYPLVVHKLKTVDTEGKTHINYYSDEATQLEHAYTGFEWEAYSTVRGQESRQYGKGK